MKKNVLNHDKKGNIENDDKNSSDILNYKEATNK